MKTIVIALLLTGVATSVAFSQETTFKKPDSVVVLEKKKQLTRELSSLQDSLRHSLALFDSTLATAKAKDIKNIQNAHVDLVNMMERVRLDSVEVGLTSVNGWDKFNAERIELNTAATRDDYHHLLTSLRGVISERKTTKKPVPKKR